MTSWILHLYIQINDALYKIHSSPTEVHIHIIQFSRWPRVANPGPGSCQVCQMVLRILFLIQCILHSQDHLTKLKWPEVGVGDRGTYKKVGWFSCAKHSEKSVYMFTIQICGVGSEIRRILWEHIRMSAGTPYGGLNLTTLLTGI